MIRKFLLMLLFSLYLSRKRKNIFNFSSFVLLKIKKYIEHNYFNNYDIFIKFKKLKLNFYRSKVIRFFFLNFGNR